MEEILNIFFESIEITESKIMDLKVEQEDNSLNYVENQKMILEKSLSHAKKELELYYEIKTKLEELLMDDENNEEFSKNLVDIQNNIKEEENVIDETRKMIREKYESINELKKEKESLEVVNDGFIEEVVKEVSSIVKMNYKR